MANYDKYLYSTGTHFISNSGSDEKGGAHGGQAGDQTGTEWRLRSWYNRPWKCVLRWPDEAARMKAAELGIKAAQNDAIGYDQWNRASYWKQLEAAGYDPAKITVPCEADCTAGVTANWKAVGKLLGIKSLGNLETDTYSTNMRPRFVKAGFQLLTDSKYLTSPDYLLPGDVLLYDDHHAAMNITKGKKATGGTTPIPQPTELKLGDRVLRKGDEGADVKELQTKLLALKYELPKYGADGDFGSETEAAVKAFQKAHGLEQDGIVGPNTVEKLEAVSGNTKEYVEITGGTVNIRTKGNTSGTVLGVVKYGEKLEYRGVNDSESGWYGVIYKGQNAWVSNKYAKLVK